jgi:hypothetical protein
LCFIADGGAQETVFPNPQGIPFVRSLVRLNKDNNRFFLVQYLDQAAT